MSVVASIKNFVRTSKLYKAYGEALLRQREQKRFLAEADRELVGLDDYEKDKVRRAYRRDLRRHMFTFSEWYHQYGLKDKSEAEKEEYISRSRAQKWYRRLISKDIRALFHEKPLFLSYFSGTGHIRRSTLAAIASTSVEDLKDRFAERDIIVKPQTGSLGAGVRKIDTRKFTDSDWCKLLDECIKGNCLVEECIIGATPLQQFHPSSLNTIRVQTAYSPDGAFGFGSFVRFGRGGSVIDNAHGGGIYCTVDVNSGTLLTDAYDVDGHTYTVHPDTGLTFKGFVIPQRGEILAACCSAHNRVHTPFVGWDVCINFKGEVEFIEGNHAPDMDIIQGPLKRGYRKQFEIVCRDFENHK